MNTKERIDKAIRRLENIRDAWDIEPDRMARKLDVTRQTYDNWRQGKTEPTLEGWFKIQDFLHGEG